ncbi:hypothetical protein BHM03_00056041 [Ensete ventricosum]|nr:hypothetical protein BHM03_00056041 [Ensete ventricosum]
MTYQAVCLKKYKKDIKKIQGVRCGSLVVVALSAAFDVKEVGRRKTTSMGSPCDNGRRKLFGDEEGSSKEVQLYSSLPLDRDRRGRTMPNRNPERAWKTSSRQGSTGSGHRDAGDDALVTPWSSFSTLLPLSRFFSECPLLPRLASPHLVAARLIPPSSDRSACQSIDGLVCTARNSIKNHGSNN